MDEGQKIRDRKMRKIRLSNRVNEDDILKMERVRNIIEDLEHHGPAGLIHIAILSNIIRKSIKVWNADNSLNSIIGKERMGPVINIEYHANDLGGIGHWTLMQGKDPDNTQFDLNSCLFSVIGAQTGLNPSELRRWTLSKIKGNFRRLAERLDKFLRLEGTSRAVLMIGGARYIGTSANDAKRILDNSQNARCYNCRVLGHPRGHASDPTQTGDTDSVERYSFTAGSPKSGFLSRNDQDIITHHALITTEAQHAMQQLNGASSMKVVVNASVLKDSYGVCFSDFKSMWFVNGHPDGIEREIPAVVMILRHHENLHQNVNADVFIHTCYPLLR